MIKIKKVNLLIAVVCAFMILFQMQAVTAQECEYYGYDAGWGCTNYDASKDELMRAYKTRVLFERPDGSSDPWKLSELKLSFMTSVNPDLDMYSNFLYLYIKRSYYCIEYVKIEAKLSQCLELKNVGLLEETFYPGSVFFTELKGHTGGDPDKSDEELKKLYNFMISNLLSKIPYVGVLGSAAFILLTDGVPLEDTFTEGNTTNSHWWKYQFGRLHIRNQLSLSIFINPTQTIPEGYFSYYGSFYHRLYLTYTVGVKLYNIITTLGRTGYDTIHAFTVSHQTIIKF